MILTHRLMIILDHLKKNVLLIIQKYLRKKDGNGCCRDKLEEILVK